jgi:mono/diheme cytochrome c family protein
MKWFMAAVVLVSMAGCSKSNQNSAGTSVRTMTSAPGTQAKINKGAQLADSEHGKVIYQQACASCHGANGAGGGVGPTLKNERSRKNMAQAISWIKNPQPPMPKLYPSPLSEKDVSDVAAYVESL